MGKHTYFPPITQLVNNFRLRGKSQFSTLQIGVDLKGLVSADSVVNKRHDNNKDNFKWKPIKHPEHLQVNLHRKVCPALYDEERERFEGVISVRGQKSI